MLDYGILLKFIFLKPLTHTANGIFFWNKQHLHTISQAHLQNHTVKSLFLHP